MGNNFFKQASSSAFPPPGRVETVDKNTHFPPPGKVPVAESETGKVRVDERSRSPGKVESNKRTDSKGVVKEEQKESEGEVIGSAPLKKEETLSRREGKEEGPGKYVRLKKEDERGGGKLVYFSIDDGVLNYYKKGHVDGEVVGSMEMKYTVASNLEKETFLISYKKKVYTITAASPDDAEAWVTIFNSYSPPLEKGAGM